MQSVSGLMTFFALLFYTEDFPMAKRFTLEDCMPLLELLTDYTRVATAEQLGKFCELYPEFSATSTPAIAMLRNCGLLICEDAAIRMPRLEKALFRWHPGDPAPDCLDLANQLHQRNIVMPWRQTRLFWATEKATSLVGGHSGLNRQPLQVQHDLCTTEVYLRVLADRYFAGSDEIWVGEDSLRCEFARFFPTKMPDAAILLDREIPIEAIEIGGVYSAGDLKRTHQSYSHKRIRYEIW